MNNFPFDAKADLTPALTGFGKIISALLPKRIKDEIIKQERHTKLSDSQTKFYCNLIENGLAEYKNGEFIQHDSLPLSLATKMEEEENLYSTLKKSFDFCQSRHDTPSEEPLSQTFFNNWRDRVRLISEDELRNVWAQILVCEVYNPNAVSLKSLEILSTLSKKEALLFNNICKSVVFDNAIIFDRVGNNSVYFDNISEFDLLDLSDLGLIKSFQPNQLIHDNIPLCNWTPLGEDKAREICHYQYGDYCIFIDGDNDLKSSKVQFRQLTKHGRELYSILSQPEERDVYKFIDYFMSLESIKGKVTNIYAFKYLDKAKQILESNYLIKR